MFRNIILIDFTYVHNIIVSSPRSPIFQHIMGHENGTWEWGMGIRLHNYIPSLPLSLSLFFSVIAPYMLRL